jgi:hypothetical protein
MELFTNNAPVVADCELGCCISRPLFLHFDLVFVSISANPQLLRCGPHWVPGCGSHGEVWREQRSAGSPGHVVQIAGSKLPRSKSVLMRETYTSPNAINQIT